MVEQIFKSPGTYFNEVDLSARVIQPSGVPAGFAGASTKGPAFVPITVGSFPDFVTKFGDLNVKYMAPYAVSQFLNNRFAATFVRVLGAGANSSSTDISTTQIKGTVINAGFALSGTIITGDNRTQGVCQFLVAKHVVNTNEALAIPMFSENSSFTLGASSSVYLVRATILTTNDARIMVMNGNNGTFTSLMPDFANIDSTAGASTQGLFKLVISSSAGTSFGNGDGNPGLKIYSASLDPSNQNYIGKILNQDPEQFSTYKHLLYCDWAVDAEVAAAVSGTAGANAGTVAIVSGSANTSATSGDTTVAFRDLYGKFTARYTTPITPVFISQPFGSTEYDLFQVEALDDGAYANNKYKICIANIKASSNPASDYGTFSLLVRDFADNDINPRILEQFTNLSLNPLDPNYIAKVIGDIKVYYNFDAPNPDDRRMAKKGKYPNKSNYIRVVVNDSVDNGLIPPRSLPFGFHGIKTLKTSDLLTDQTNGNRLAASGALDARLLSAVVPPLPFRAKVTTGPVSTTSSFVGNPGPSEVVNSLLFWGVKAERNNNLPNLDVNLSNTPNTLIPSYTKFVGIEKLDAVVTGSGIDTFNNNKFTLARVALYNGAVTDVTAAVNTHMLQTAYIRNGVVNASNYTVSDGVITRITLASLLPSQSTDANNFNRFIDFAKFTTIMQGGWDGLNILDKDAARLGDKGTSTEPGGGSNVNFSSPGFTFNQAGTGLKNNAVNSFMAAVNILTDQVASNVNIVALPGIREPLITDYASNQTRAFQLAIYLMDIPYYDFNINRIFDGDIGKYLDVTQTSNQFDSRAIDNDYVAAYFPNIVIDDTSNNRRVTVPATVGAAAAFGFNDRLSYPWFAPAGFNRAALDFVRLTQVRINQPDRDQLYQMRINPIVKFPGENFVLFSQLTLKQAKTALQSINVRRMMLEVKRSVIAIGNGILWDQITPQTRQRFVSQVAPVLATIQAKQGIDFFQVICDSTNNTQADIDANRINGKIIIKPTLSAEIVALDFIVMPSGVAFVSG